MFQVNAYHPHPLLRQIVNAYLVVSVKLPEDRFVEYNFLPHVNQSLVIGMDEFPSVYECQLQQYCPGDFIAGSREGVRKFRLYGGMEKFVVDFRPGGFYKLFQLSAILFSNRCRDAEILGSRFQDLRGRMEGTPLSEKLAMADQFLLTAWTERKKPEKSIDEAIRLIEAHKGNISIRQLEEATFTTKRTLERRFLEQTGVYPKTFSRLIRFGQAIRFIESNLHVKWRQIAEAFGYYDQSHFIHEFRSVAGCPPNDFFTLPTEFGKILQV